MTTARTTAAARCAAAARNAPPSVLPAELRD